MAQNVKNMLKRTGTHGAASSISKIVDFIEAEPVGSAFFLSSPCVILSGAKDPAFIS